MKILKWSVILACFGLVWVPAIEVFRVLLGRNVHCIIPGRVYRCAQQSGADLEELIETYGIGTVINLRGPNPPLGWYEEECRATHRRNVDQVDITLSVGRLPSPENIRQLVEVLDHTSYPIVFHCRRGADRTGLASAIAMLLLTDAGLDEGRRQLGLRYGHLPIGRPKLLDTFLDLYDAWLKEKGINHSRMIFRTWLKTAYCPGQCRARLELLEAPPKAACGKPIGVRIRVHNSSNATWHMHPEANVGVHVGSMLMDSDGRWQELARSGFLEAAVLPGETIDLTLVVPAFKKPGRYRLLIDMIDEQQGWFYQLGSEPIETEIEVMSGTQL